MSGILVVMLISAIVGGIGILSLVDVKKAEAKLVSNDVLGLEYAGAASVNFMQLRYFLLKQTTLTKDADAENNWKEVEIFQQATNEQMHKMHAIDFANDNIDLLIDKIEQSMDQYNSGIDQLKGYIDADKIQLANTYTLNNLAPIGMALRDDYLNLLTLVTEDAANTTTANEKSMTGSIVLMTIVVGVAVAVTFILGQVISRAIANPVKKMERLAEALSVGDIDVSRFLDEKDLLIKTQKDEIGGLASAFDKLVTSTKMQIEAIHMVSEGDLTTDVSIRSEQDVLGKSLKNLVSKLNGLVTTIVSASEQVASGAGLVSNSSLSLSQGATEQASAIQQLTASIEEIKSQTDKNADNAKKVNIITRSAKENAAGGNGHMNEMLNAMEEINNASGKISKIIKVIDDIAFQTNILALNAAVEAARAGQHGRGFAVVAEEVRSLAAKSAQAAKETTELIESTIRTVETGTRIANNTAGALASIVTDVDRVAELVATIAEASEEQAGSLEQINVGVYQVSQVVQTNAATAEESAAASEELSAQAEQLRQTMSTFKVTGNRGALPSGAGEKAETGSPGQLSKLLAGRAVRAGKPEIHLTDDNFGKY
jgi:methyl-accepting chemotaxis protein